MMDPEDMMMSSGMELDMESISVGRESFLMALETIQMIQKAVFPYAMTGKKAWICLQKSALKSLVANRPVALDEYSDTIH